MTSEDRTVQVPVSLIERWAEDLSRLLPPGTYAIRSELRALLSQPPVSLPTREQIAARLRGDIFDAVPDDNDMQHVLSLAADLLSQPTPTAVFGDDRGVVLSDGSEVAAEPPRIEDMAPGTRIAVAHSWTVMRSPHGSTFLYREDGGYSRIALPSDIDPSTIRDVTLPKEK